jgi:hypothetical protein
LRKLRISLEKSGVEYDYCVDYKFFGDDCKEWKTDFYDFNDKNTRAKLRAMGFKLSVEKL